MVLSTVEEKSLSRRLGLNPATSLEYLSLGFSTMSDTNQAVLAQMKAKTLKKGLGNLRPDFGLVLVKN